MGITQPDAEHFERGLWGWNGSVWVKLNILFGLKDGYLEQDVYTAPNTNPYLATLTAVPADEVWIVTAITISGDNTDPHVWKFGIDRSSTYYPLRGEASMTANVVYHWEGWAVLEYGDKLYYYLAQPFNGGTYTVVANGFKMDVA